MTHPCSTVIDLQQKAVNFAANFVDGGGLNKLIVVGPKALLYTSPPVHNVDGASIDVVRCLLVQRQDRLVCSQARLP